MQAGASAVPINCDESRSGDDRYVVTAPRITRSFFPPPSGAVNPETMPVVKRCATLFATDHQPPAKRSGEMNTADGHGAHRQPGASPDPKAAPDYEVSSIR